MSSSCRVSLFICLFFLFVWGSGLRKQDAFLKDVLSERIEDAPRHCFSRIDQCQFRIDGASWRVPMSGADGWQPATATLDKDDFDGVAVVGVAEGRADSIEPVIDEPVYGIGDDVVDVFGMVLAVVVAFRIREVAVDLIEFGDVLFGEAVDDVLDIHMFVLSVYVFGL